MSIRAEDLHTTDFSDIADDTLPPVHPGEILALEFMDPMGITAYKLAKAIGVPQTRIGEILAEKRSITADTGLRLSRFFGMSDGFWIGLQAEYDADKARATMGAELARIEPYARAG